MEFGASQVALVKNPPANAGDIRDASLIPGSGRFLEEEMATHSSILTWEIPRTEKPGRLQSMWLQRVRYDLATKPPPETDFEGWGMQCAGS